MELGLKHVLGFGVSQIFPALSQTNMEPNTPVSRTVIYRDGSKPVSDHDVTLSRNLGFPSGVVL